MGCSLSAGGRGLPRPVPGPEGQGTSEVLPAINILNQLTYSALRPLSDDTCGISGMRGILPQ